MVKCLVTGACGFIGSHLCEALRDAGHDVTGMAWRKHTRFGWLDEVEGVKKTLGDVRDFMSLRSELVGKDICFHLAAEIDVAASFERPQDFIETNLIGTLRVLEACKEYGVKLVHTSSSEVYGTAQYTPQDETHPLQAQSPYAASKIAADALVDSYRRSYGIETVTLRPFNTYGPRQSDRAVIGKIMALAHGPSEALTLGSLTPMRDFTYVTDTVAAFLKVMELHGGPYNCGTGRWVSIEEVAKLAGNGKPIEQDPDLARPKDSEIWGLRADYEQLAKATGWRPQVDLADGLRLTAEWHDSRRRA